MISMKLKEYQRLYDRLNRPEDIDKLAESTDYPRELLLVIYSQRSVRDVTKRYYRVKHRVKHLLKRWKRGESFLSISRDLNFSPIMTAMLVMAENKISRKMFWKYVQEPDEIRDRRLRREIKEIVESDILYSPWGKDIQVERGKEGERRLYEWLDRYDIKYLTEEELKRDYPKTPDALLDRPIRLNGMDVKWIESKATFGDKVEISRNVKRQLRPYVDLFGPGIVVYWFGYLEGLPPQEDIMMVDDEFFSSSGPRPTLPRSD